MDRIKIPLQIVNGMISVVVGVRIPQMRIWGVNKFFIDTGSPESFIGEQDANRLKIPMSNLTFNKFALMAGTKISLCHINGVQLSFMALDDKPIKFPMEDFNIAKGEWTRGGIIHSNPSILGTDFLKSNDIILVFYPSKDMAHLLVDNAKEGETEEQVDTDSETTTPIV